MAEIAHAKVWATACRWKLNRLPDGLEALIALELPYRARVPMLIAASWITKAILSSSIWRRMPRLNQSNL